MIPFTILLAFATACTPDGIDREQPESTSCEAGFILDGSVCIPESCRTGTWGNLPVDSDTVYVDMAAEEGGDGTEAAPYVTIQRGLNRAGALGGGLVAVAAGTYPETLEFTTDHADVRLAGRCREMVILDASVGDEETPGIEIDAGYGAVEVSGLTVRDSSYVGIEVASGVVVMRDQAILGSTYLGFLAQHPGLSGTNDVSLESCLIEGNVTAGVIIGNSGTQAFLRDTTIRDTLQDANGEYGRGIEVYDGATLSVEGCLIDGNTDIGVVASDPDTLVTLRNTTVKDTQPDGNGEFGWGIQVQTGATLSAEGCLIEGNTDVGMLATDPRTQVTFHNTIARDTHPDGKGQYGRGIEVYDDATFIAEACLIEGNTDVGLLVSNPGTQVTLWNTTVKDTHPDGAGGYGLGISVEDGAILSAEGCLIEGNTDAGMIAQDAGTQVVLLYTTVKNTHPMANGDAGFGIEVSGGAALSAKGCLIEGNTAVGMLTCDTGTQVTVRDTTVRNTQSDANGETGRGIEVQDGGTLSTVDCLIEGNTEYGVRVLGAGTLVTLLRTTVKNTQSNGYGEYGWGVNVKEGANLTAEGCLIEENAEVGLVVGNPGTRITLRDTTVRNTRPNANGEAGWGVAVQDRATLSAQGCLIEGNSEIGLSVGEPGTQIVLVETTVKDMRPNADGNGGYGIQVNSGATLSADRCLIEGNTDVGVLASDAGTQVVLRDSTVSKTKSGYSLRSSAPQGVAVQEGALLSASLLALLSNQGPGIIVNGHGARMECAGCLVEDNRFAGAVVVRDGILAISNSTIEGTTSGTNLGGGAGIYAWPWDGGPPTVTLTNTIIRDNPIAGVWLIGNGTYVLTGNTISGGIGEPYGSGSRCGDAILALDGVAAWDGTSGLLLQDNMFQNAYGSGVFLDDSSALMSSNTYSDNAVDLVVQNQSCDPTPAWYSEAPQRDLCPVFDYPTCYAEFFFVAMPAEPVDWEEDKAAPRPRFLPLDPVSLARPIHPIMPITRRDHPSHYPSLSR